MAPEGNEHNLDGVVDVKPQAGWRAIAPGGSEGEGGMSGEDYASRRAPDATGGYLWLTGGVP